jgi:hypothetical protein
MPFDWRRGLTFNPEWLADRYIRIADINRRIQIVDFCFRFLEFLVVSN